MNLWLVRAGRAGQFESKFLDDGRVYVTWSGLTANIKKMKDKQELVDILNEYDEELKPAKVRNWVSQIWPFAHSMEIGDWVVMPSKLQPVIYVGKITSDYTSNPAGPNPFYHWRAVDWFGQEIPRSNFSQDILHSFGAFLTICRIKRNNAAERIQAMAKNNWQAESKSAILKSAASKNVGIAEARKEFSLEDAADDQDDDIDLEYTARQQVISLIEARFKGHDLTRLVNAILIAQGYTTWQSPQGADGGADILASNGPMGFGNQSICVEVKSGKETLDRSTVDKLLGAMSKFNSQHGLFVAWGGFKQNVQKELAVSFHKLRLWTQDDLLEQLFISYDKLDDEIKAELPLKRIWTVALTDND